MEQAAAWSAEGRLTVTRSQCRSSAMLVWELSSSTAAKLAREGRVEGGREGRSEGACRKCAQQADSEQQAWQPAGSRAHSLCTLAGL